MINKVEAMKIWRKRNHQEKNALIDSVTLKKSTKNYAQKWNMQNIDFSADNAMKVITTMIFANFVSKFIRVLQIQMMMINGLDAIHAVDG